MTHRTLRSKKLRTMLYYSQNGKCAMCGRELPDNWHADHITPYVVTHRTNVHEMQALCPTCNLKKGKKMLRKHQADMQKIAIDISAGTNKATNILVHVTPGGGKSALPMILAKELAERLGYRICWVVPRDNLRSQGERGFIEQRPLFGHNSEIRAASNEPRPARDTIGYITTYQAIAANPELHADEFRLRKYILFLDECHHIPDKGQSEDQEEAKYYKAVKPLVELAAIRVFASGTLERHDGNFIAFLPYIRNTNAEIIDMSPRPGWSFIRYSRKDALEEGAIVPLHFHMMDARATWLDPTSGVIRNVESMAASSIKDQPNVLKTVLETKYAHQLLDKCATDWKGHKQHKFQQAKMLVIAPSIKVASKYCEYLKDKSLNALIATSDDSDEAKNNIERFKRENIDVLVTVGMAYEGLDVPQITHVACLTNIRSKPWIEQCICRANRTCDGKTHGYIYYPDEPRINQIIDDISREQASAVITYPPKPPQTKSPIGGTRLGVAPIGSEANGAERSQEVNGKIILDYSTHAALQNVLDASGMTGVISTVQFAEMINMLGSVELPRANGTAQGSTMVLTPSMRESQLRKALEQSVWNVAKRAVVPVDRKKEISGQIANKFGKVSTMSEQTLISALQWLNNTYGEAVCD